MKTVKHLLRIILPLFLLFCTGCRTAVTETESYDLSGKTFYCTDSADTNVWFGKDGSFVLQDGSGKANELTGTWTAKEDVATLEPDKTDAGKIIFEISDEEKIILKSTLSSAASDTVFTLTRPVAAAPVSTPSPSPSAKPEPAAASASPTAETEPEDITYYNASQENMFGTSFLQFYNDGTFSLTDVQGMGAVEIRGLYGQEGKHLMFSNFSDNFYDMNGSQIYNFEMEVYDEDTLILQKDLNGSRAGDVFTISGTIPEELAVTTVPAVSRTVWVFTPDPSWGVSPGYEPTVEFESDGTFTLTENCFAGMGQYKGTYEKTDTGYTCSVKDAASMQGFAGGDVKTIIFEQANDVTLVLKTDLCMSQNGNTFILQ